MRTHREFKIPEIFVPFDFDGKRILWMEYKEEGVKEFQCYNLASKQITTIKNFGSQFHFLSFGKLIGKDVIFIENNKNVKLLNTENNTIMDLYSHSSSIIAFDVAEREEKYYRLTSVDFNGVYKEWKNGSVTRTYALWHTKNVPEGIKKHQYLFDMGYPYYMKVMGNILAITTDLGLCLFRI